MNANRLFWVVIAVHVACGPKNVVRMEPLEFMTTKTPGGIEVVVMDPQVLFEEGVTAFQEKRHEEAARKFELVLKYFGTSRFAKAALYNRGLALLAATRLAEAARDFEDFIKQYPDDPDIPDAMLRLGQALSEAGEWLRAEKILAERLEIQPLTLLQEVEIRARRALALRMLGRYEDARIESSKVLSLHDKYLTLPEMEGNYYVSMASFQAAEVFHELFARIKFVLPVERMEKDLLDKATLFMKAQSEYLRTIRLRNTYWGVLAGIRIGRLYEEFYEDIMAAEVPPDLTAEEYEIYLAELKRKARPLIAKAVDAYERNYALAKTYGAKDEWFGDIKERLERLRKLLSEIPAPSDH